MATGTDIKSDAQFFSLHTPLLAEGRSDTTVAQTDLLRMRLKVYASGGENVLHFHPYEDHSFVVLAGEATFHIGTEDDVKVLSAYEGVMIPRGVSYWFQSSAAENLVMLRAGAAEKWPDEGRLGPDGRPLPGHSSENKHVAGVPIPGPVFRRLIRRGPFIASAAAAFALRPATARAQTLTPLRVTCVPNDDVTPLLYAQQSGLFRRAGLDVTVTPATSGAAIAAAVVSGSYDIGLISLMATITGHARGLPFVMIAPSLLYLASDPAQQLLVLKDSPIRDVHDLPGKIVSCSAIRDVSWVSIRAWADQHGVDSSTIKFVEIPMSAIRAALEQKRIDAGSILNPSLQEALATGNFRSIGAPFDGVAKRWLVAAWSTTTDFVTKNRDTVDRFASVMHAATLYFNSHHAETAPLIAAFANMDPAQALAMKPVDLAEYLDPRDIQPAIDAAAKYGVIDKSFPATDMISPYAPKAPR